MNGNHFSYVSFQAEHSTKTQLETSLILYIYTHTPFGRFKNHVDTTILQKYRLVYMY